MLKYDIAVVGAGPAGLAAAIEAAKNGGGRILLLERDREMGGILQQCIHNGFGLHIFKEELTGPEYAERFINELKEMNIEYKLNTMVINIAKDRVITAVNMEDGLIKIETGAIILAMGCRERTRGAINIPGMRPAGIFTAGTSQRFVNMEGYIVGRKIVILGSGDVGLIMARRLTLEGAKVQVVAEVLPYPGGLTRNIVQCLEDYDIPLLLSHTVIDIKGRDRVEGVTIAEVDQNRKPIPGTEKYYECDTLLLSVGLIPENELSKSAGIDMDTVTGGAAVNESMETSVEGIFACGNVLHVHDLVDYVTEESRRAGRNAALYVNNMLKKDGGTVHTKAKCGVRYIVPQKIRVQNVESSLDLFLRVDKIYENKTLTVRVGDDIVKEMRKRFLRPGEMERINISREILESAQGSFISVEVGGGE